MLGLNSRFSSSQEVFFQTRMLEFPYHGISVTYAVTGYKLQVLFSGITFGIRRGGFLPSSLMPLFADQLLSPVSPAIAS
jgi:hypothetical protein